ncbi:MAG TPA: hypothetical protein VGB05_05520 [Pyrinomonadaceae bacterium]
MALHTNDQVRDYVLCPRCEQRFDENGERWVMRNCYRGDHKFKLKDFIDASQPVIETRSQVYSAALIPQIDIEKLTYFVASIIWRNSVHDWRSGKDKVARIYLGPYREELRHYLLGETSFPQNAALVLSIIPDSNLWNFFSFPIGGKVNQHWQYNFSLLGLSFMFFLGGLIDPIITKICTYRSPEKFIFMTDDANQMVFRDFGKLIKKSRPVGSLNND